MNELKLKIEQHSNLTCKEPEQTKKPDIRVVDVSSGDLLICRVEAKFLQGKAFVKSSKIVRLRPKETLVIDEPKLLHYFSCKDADLKKYRRNVPLFVVWMFNRPCDDIGGITVFQEIDKLRKIHAEHPYRRHDRGTASNDFVAGVKRGITAKYHFSIKETRPIEDLLPAIAQAERSAKTAAQSHAVTAEQRHHPRCADCCETFTPKFPGAKLCLQCWRQRQ
ncbi:hypothetical protein QWY20_15255 [Alkalimonas sp. MEB108]|uniref:Uncharacterized protein n=1 Tax=Alkalimonas cellulosilytica TaxID=3058395 RepID=A0ABU7J8M8_9GAMM|nr:hypothetical protein [Alkalimonas sp. MEB108]MEE2002817.1 hypothetical protein [Alkalimonas sp. MEB108]